VRGDVDEAVEAYEQRILRIDPLATCGAGNGDLGDLTLDLFHTRFGLTGLVEDEDSVGGQIVEGGRGFRIEVRNVVLGLVAIRAGLKLGDIAGNALVEAVRMLDSAALFVDLLERRHPRGQFLL